MDGVRAREGQAGGNGEAGRLALLAPTDLFVQY